MMMVSKEDQEVIDHLTANWVWVADWIDSSVSNSPVGKIRNTAGRIVTFTRTFDLSPLSRPGQRREALLHFSADTRYKLYVNGVRVAVGPARSSPLIWYYDSLDIAPHLCIGKNEVKFVVLRYFAATRAAMPFERTAFPGLTVHGGVLNVEEGAGAGTAAKQLAVDLSSTNQEWRAQVDESVEFPTGLIDDVFLHISERVAPTSSSSAVIPTPYNLKTLNGELAPWRLRPRSIPMPEESRADVKIVRTCQSLIASSEWTLFLSGKTPLVLPGESSHVLDLQADVHSTAFLRWSFRGIKSTEVRLKITYSEGYELEPRSYPFFRTKGDRLDFENGQIIGPYDEIILSIPEAQTVTYEPFWFRTFRVMRVDLTIGSGSVELTSFEATQVNYPMSVKASWKEPGDAHSEQIWDVSIRTMRNCMFDGYSDCPFYEQLQYCCDSRSVGLFHYLLSGDDRLMRQSMDNFAASITFEGLTQSRFPSHVKQVIAGFSLYWILQICDHYLYFGDKQYARSFLPRIDGVLDFFDSHINDKGLVGGLPEDVWQYVDWVTTWGATETHPDKGVPMSGRKSNIHTYFSMLYAYVLQQAAQLLRNISRPALSAEYDLRAASLLQAIRRNCYDGRFFTDSTADVADDLAYSQHCQVFAVISGAAKPADHARLLTECLKNPRFSACSYMMKFYLLRAFAIAGDEVYESNWASTWDAWRQMLRNNLTTWEEDDVRQRSDCHAWGSVPIFEYCTELAGIHISAPGATKILFKPRIRLSDALQARVALGKENLAQVSWSRGQEGRITVELQLEKAVEVTSQLPEHGIEEHGLVKAVKLIYDDR